MKNHVSLFLFLFVSTILILAGCTTEGNVTPGLSNSAYAAEAEVQQLRAEIDDVGFWSTLDCATDAIKELIETNKDISVGFRMTTSGGETILLEDMYVFRLNYINDVWRGLTASQIEYMVATNEQVKEAEDDGQTVEVTGVIIKWNEPDPLNGADRILSAADIDCDGQWDFATEGKFYFTDSASASIPGTDNAYGAIGTIDVVSSAIINVEELESPTLSSMAEMVQG